MNKLNELLSWYKARDLILSSNPVILWSKRLTISTNILSFLIVGITFTKLPPLLPLWYSMPWGETRLVAPIWLFILPLVTFFIQILNLLVSLKLPDEFLLFTQLLGLTSFIVSLMSIITLVNIILLVK